MAKRTGPTNLYLQELIRNLKKLSNKEKVNIWKAVAKNLEKPTRKRRKVNLSKINKYAKENETILVPGKVLSSGKMEKNTTIAAFQFSEAARMKLGNNAVSIQTLMEKNPKGKNIRIIG